VGNIHQPTRLHSGQKQQAHRVGFARQRAAVGATQVQQAVHHVLKYY
jgi:hypothetical protein